MGNRLSSSSLGDKEEPLIKGESDEGVAFVEEEEEEDDDEGLIRGRTSACLFSVQGKRGVNQDAAIICKEYGAERGLFCGVFDGHGKTGHAVSRMVRDRLPSLLLDERNALSLAAASGSPSVGSVDEWKAAFASAFRAMDQELRRKPNLDCTYSGTTAVSVAKQGKDLIIANLGDSRAVMGTASEEGHLRAIQLTTDLKPNVPEEAERIRKRKGRVFALKDEPRVHRVWLPNANFPGLAMARSFGDLQLKRYGVISRPHLSHHRLTAGDLFLVLATDGVWDVLSNEEVASIVWSTASNEDASRAVVEAARREWRSRFAVSKADDCTAACVFFQERSKGATELLLPAAVKKRWARGLAQSLPVRVDDGN